MKPRSTLSLLVFGVLTYDIYIATSSDNLAVFAQIFDGTFDLHLSSIYRPRYGTSLLMVCLILDDSTSNMRDISRFALFDLRLR